MPVPHAPEFLPIARSWLPQQKVGFVILLHIVIFQVRVAG
jgi:hypothetical protein